MYNCLVLVAIVNSFLQFFYFEINVHCPSSSLVPLLWQFTTRVIVFYLRHTNIIMFHLISFQNDFFYLPIKYI